MPGSQDKENPSFSEVLVAVWRGRKGAQLVALAGPDVLLKASLLHLGMSVAVLFAGLWMGLPVFEDRAWTPFIPLLPLFMLVSFYSAGNSLLIAGFFNSPPFWANLFFCSAGTFVYCLLLALMGLVLHLPLGQEIGAVANGVLLVLGVGWMSVYLYWGWVEIANARRVVAVILCLPSAVIILGGSVFLWLAVYGLDKLSWDPYFYL